MGRARGGRRGCRPPRTLRSASARRRSQGLASSTRRSPGSSPLTARQRCGAVAFPFRPSPLLLLLLDGAVLTEPCRLLLVELAAAHVGEHVLAYEVVLRIEASSGTRSLHCVHDARVWPHAEGVVHAREPTMPLSW